MSPLTITFLQAKFTPTSGVFCTALNIERSNHDTRQLHRHHHQHIFYGRSVHGTHRSKHCWRFRATNQTPIAQGGEAVVHSVPQYPGVVVKLYHPQVLQRRSDTLRTKIEAMTIDPKLAKFKRHAGLSLAAFLGV